jgi:hypothetical protein
MGSKTERSLARQAEKRASDKARSQSKTTASKARQAAKKASADEYSHRLSTRAKEKADLKHQKDYEYSHRLSSQAEERKRRNYAMRGLEYSQKESDESAPSNSESSSTYRSPGFSTIPPTGYRSRSTNSYYRDRFAKNSLKDKQFKITRTGGECTIGSNSGGGSVSLKHADGSASTYSNTSSITINYENTSSLYNKPTNDQLLGDLANAVKSTNPQTPTGTSATGPSGDPITAGDITSGYLPCTEKQGCNLTLPDITGAYDCSEGKQLNVAPNGAPLPDGFVCDTGFFSDFGSIMIPCDNTPVSLNTPEGCNTIITGGGGSGSNSRGTVGFIDSISLNNDQLSADPGAALSSTFNPAIYADCPEANSDWYEDFGVGGNRPWNQHELEIKCFALLESAGNLPPYKLTMYHNPASLSNVWCKDRAACSVWNEERQLYIPYTYFNANVCNYIFSKYLVYNNETGTYGCSNTPEEATCDSCKTEIIDNSYWASGGELENTSGVQDVRYYTDKTGGNWYPSVTSACEAVAAIFGETFSHAEYFCCTWSYRCYTNERASYLGTTSGDPCPISTPYYYGEINGACYSSDSYVQDIQEYKQCGYYIEYEIWCSDPNGEEYCYDPTTGAEFVSKDDFKAYLVPDGEGGYKIDDTYSPPDYDPNTDPNYADAVANAKVCDGEGNELIYKEGINGGQVVITKNATGPDYYIYTDANNKIVSAGDLQYSKDWRTDGVSGY